MVNQSFSRDFRHLVDPQVVHACLIFDVVDAVFHLVLCAGRWWCWSDGCLGNEWWSSSCRFLSAYTIGSCADPRLLSHAPAPARQRACCLPRRMTGDRLGRPSAERPTSFQMSLIGRASLARENEAGGSWRQEVHILHVNI